VIDIVAFFRMEFEHKNVHSFVSCGWESRVLGGGDDAGRVICDDDAAALIVVVAAGVVVVAVAFDFENNHFDH
jgi:hypothetical protein